MCRSAFVVLTEKALQNPIGLKSNHNLPYATFCSRPISIGIVAHGRILDWLEADVVDALADEGTVFNRVIQRKTIVMEDCFDHRHSGMPKIPLSVMADLASIRRPSRTVVVSRETSPQTCVPDFRGDRQPGSDDYF
jgi:hypothetical protein